MDDSLFVKSTYVDIQASFLRLLFYHAPPLTPLCICVFISEVDLSDNRLGDYGAKAIAGMLKENGTLVSLNLSGNHFTDQTAEHLKLALITNTKLQHLNLSYNALGDRAGIAR